MGYSKGKGGSGGVLTPEQASAIASISTLNVIPSGYTFVNDSGDLVLFDADNVEVARWNVDEYTVPNSYRVGPNSTHYSDLFSVGVGGDTLVTINESTNESTYPSTGTVSLDGSDYTPVTDRVYGDYVDSMVNGAINLAQAVDYNFSFTSTSDVTFFYIEVNPAEDYSGDVTWYSLIGGSVFSKIRQKAQTITTGINHRIQFEYPLTVKTGEELTVYIKKEDGTYLSCYTGSDLTTPWRLARLRPFTDETAINTGNVAEHLPSAPVYSMMHRINGESYSVTSGNTGDPTYKVIPLSLEMVNFQGDDPITYNDSTGYFSLPAGYVYEIFFKVGMCNCDDAVFALSPGSHYLRDVLRGSLITVRNMDSTEARSSNSASSILVDLTSETEVMDLFPFKMSSSESGVVYTHTETGDYEGFSLVIKQIQKAN